MSGAPVDLDRVIDRMELEAVDAGREIRWLETRAAEEDETAAAAAVIAAYQTVEAAGVVPEAVACSVRAAAVAVAAADEPAVDTDLAAELRRAAFELRDADEPTLPADARETFERAVDAVRLRRTDRIVQTTDLDADLDDERERLQDEAAANSRIRAAGVVKGLRALREREDVDLEDRALAERAARHAVDTERDRTSGTRSATSGGVGSADVVHRFATHAATPLTEDDLTWPSIAATGDEYSAALSDLVAEMEVDEVLTTTDAHREYKELERTEARDE